MPIKVKLIVILTALVALPLLCVSLVTVLNYRRSLESSRFAQMQELARYKTDILETYFVSLKTNMAMVQGFSSIERNLTELAGWPVRKGVKEVEAARHALDNQLKRIVDAIGLAGILLADTAGLIVYAQANQALTDNLPAVLDSMLRVPTGEPADEARIVDLIMDTASADRPGVYVIAPARDGNGKPAGTIVFIVDMLDLSRQIRDTVGLGSTGEVLVGKRRGDDIFYLFPRRHVSTGYTNDVPLQKAVDGETGFGNSTDYRARQVIAAWRHIPALGWGLVTKIDRKEGRADVAGLQRFLLAILIVSLSVTGVVVLGIAQSIVVPIQKLSKGAERVGNGDLDYKVGTSTHDEIGHLSRSFDKMTSDLKSITASRDELNREIAEREKTQQMLKVTAAELRRSNNDLEQFAYVASHDLQEPLRAVGGFISLLKVQYTDILDKRAREYIDLSVGGAERMQTLIQDLLSYSHVGTKGGVYKIMQLQTALDDALHDLRPAIEEAGAKVTFDPMPEVRADSTQITQVFRNLVGNAVKFHGDRTPVVHVSAQRKDEFWDIQVSDNGIGIDSEHFDRIFLIFQRLHSRSKYPGTGIGLALCKRIVEQHGGTIRVVSQPGQGAEFHFTIPDGKEHV